MRQFGLHMLLAAVVLLGASLGATEVSAQGFYYGTGYQEVRAFVPYNNSYHGYWRDQGYGYTRGRVVGVSYQNYGFSPVAYPYAGNYYAAPRATSRMRGRRGRR